MLVAIIAVSSEKLYLILELLQQEVAQVHLTQYTTFALRTLQHLALRDPVIVTVDDVAQAHRISKAHLVKVSHELGQRGYIQTIRGRNGGMKLARPADQIVVGEVVCWTEAPLELVECFNPDTNTCPLEGACHLSRAFLSVLDDMTIADITVNRGILLDRLAPSQRAHSKPYIVFPARP